MTEFNKTDTGRYSSGVLVGNWAEERNKFYKKPYYPLDTTYQVDYIPHPVSPPDYSIRREALLRDEGIGRDLMFRHHGNKYDRNRITWYDQDYNKRERLPEDRLPELRSFETGVLGWVPERSDYPVQGEPTNWGLRHEKRRKWEWELANMNQSIYRTNHRISYLPPDPEDFERSRKTTPHIVSVPPKRNKRIIDANSNLTYRSLVTPGRAYLRQASILPGADVRFL